jgi:hypothetical protein
LIIPGDLPGIKPVKDLPEVFPLPQDGPPAQPCLESLQDKKLEEEPVIVDGKSPFLVVVTAIE